MSNIIFWLHPFPPNFFCHFLSTSLPSFSNDVLFEWPLSWHLCFFSKLNKILPKIRLKLENIYSLIYIVSRNLSSIAVRGVFRALPKFCDGALSRYLFPQKCFIIDVWQCVKYAFVSGKFRGNNICYVSFIQQINFYDPVVVVDCLRCQITHRGKNVVKSINWFWMKTTVQQAAVF